MLKKMWMTLRLKNGARLYGQASLSLFCLLLIVVVAGFSAGAAAQNGFTGEWQGKLVEGNSKINLNFALRPEKAGKHQFGQNYDFAELGISREQALNGGPVRFTIALEAGTIEGEGSFQNGSGSGTFRFTPNASFVSAMKSRGFDFEKDANKGSRTHDGERAQERLFTAAGLNVTTALADDLLTAGLGKLEVEDLFKAAIFKVDSKYAREMTASGFPNLGMEDLVKAKIFEVDAELMRQASEMGFGKQNLEDLVKLRIFKVTPEFIAEMRNEGLTDLSIENLVQLRVFKIDSEFIRRAKADGVPLKVEALVQRRIAAKHKVAI